MGHYFEKGRGVFVREPSWHRLENAVLPEHLTSWEDARKHARLDWEVFSEPVFVREIDSVTETGEEVARFPEVSGFQAVRRDDTRAVLAVQPSSYALIGMERFGDVIESVAGAGLRYEAAFSLYDGKMIVALLYFEEPLTIPGDNSQNFTYLAMINRFDGQGGLRGIPTNIRVQCANTLNAAEATDGKNVGFSIRHTTNWAERISEAAEIVQGARRDAQAWQVLANRLGAFRVSPNQTQTFLSRFLPTATDMTERQVRNVEVARDQVREVLASETCEHINRSGYGLVMAATEWADHVRANRSDDTLAARQLLRKELPKARAVRIACQMGHVDRRALLAEALS